MVLPMERDAFAQKPHDVQQKEAMQGRLGFAQGVEEDLENSSSIAVIGIGCRYPGASNPKQLWENILARRQQFRQMPDCRLPLSEYHHPDPKHPEKIYSTRAAVMDGFHFDWATRRIPKSTYEHADIAHWLALDVALDTLDDSGIQQALLPRDKTAVFLGNTLTGEQFRSISMRQRWPFVEKAVRTGFRSQGLTGSSFDAAIEATAEAFLSVFPETDEDTLAGLLSNTIAGRICNYLDLQGGGYVVDGACASSLLAVINACERLSLGEVDIAFAGGVDISLDTFELIGFAKAGALTPDIMRVYDERANGFIPGEGCGFVLLKRFQDALRDNDYVYALLRGWGVSSDGKGGITAPASYGQSLALERAYIKAGYSPQSLNFIEGHGTGTRVGDKAELKGIQLVLDRFNGKQNLDSNQEQERHVGVTSFKSLVGHTKAAAGIGGLIKAISAVNRRVVPPTAGCASPSPVFSNETPSLYPVLEGVVHPPEATLRAGVSAMGFGGINAHITLQSARSPAARLCPDIDEQCLLASAQDSEVFVLGAATWPLLIDALGALRSRVEGLSLAELIDLSAHLVRTYEPSVCTVALVSDSPAALVDAIDALCQQLLDAPPCCEQHRPFAFWHSHDRKQWACERPDVHSAARIAFVFPGQGSQALNCARILVKRYVWAKRLVEQADAWIAEVGGSPIASCLYPPALGELGDSQSQEHAARLQGPAYAQNAIVLSALLWTRYLRSELGVEPVITAGHSLGELVALYVAGALDEKALVQLTAIRSQYMAACGEGAMAGFGCDAETAESLLAYSDAYAVVANRNSPRQTVLSGQFAAIDQLLEVAKEKGIAARRLAVTGGFHSHLVESAGKALAADARVAAEAKLSLPLASSIATVGKLKGDIDVRAHVGKQVAAPVDFIAATEVLAEDSDVILELGPGQVLSRLIGDTLAGREQSPLCMPIEPTAGQGWAHAQLLAALSICGHASALDKSFGARLHRPFVDVAERRFIESPCERPMTVTQAHLQANDATAGSAQTSISGIFDDAWAELDPQTRQAYQDERATLIDQLQGVLARDVQQFIGQYRRDTQGGMSAAKTSPLSLASSSSTEEQIDSVSVAVQSADLAAMLLQLVAEKTGFPLESLSMQQRLLDDLRLDSIKAAEFIVEAATQASVDTTALNPMNFANASLDEIRGALLDLAPEHAATDAATQETTESSMTFPATPWTRNFDPIWEPEPLEADSSLSQWADTSVLLCADASSTMADALAEALGAEGVPVRRYRWGDSPEPLSAERFSDVIAFVPADREAEGEVMKAIEAWVVLLCELAQLAGSKQTTPLRLLWVQQSSAWAPEGRVWSADAFICSLALERPHLCARSLLVHTRLSSADLLRCLSAERAAMSLPHASVMERVWFAPDEMRHVLRLSLSQPASYKPRRNSLKAGDVALVTGGAKGITAECALGLGQALGLKMVLVGSSPEESVTQQLKRFEDANVDALYLQCDLADPDAVKELVASVRERVGHIDALIHGAGLNRPGVLMAPKAQAALAEMAPKLMGGSTLLAALDDDPPQLVAMFSSVIGVIGMMGNAWYAFANECLDLQLGQFLARHPEVEGVSLGYSVWEDVGMGVNLGSLETLKKLGIDTVPVKEGVQRFLRLLSHDSQHRQVVIGGRMGAVETGKPVALPPPQRKHQFLERVLYVHPQLEALVESTLDFERDAFLHDHVFQGNCLMPAVVVMEAMAQTVAYLLGRDSITPLEVQDLVFMQPVTVPENGRRTIRIHAMVKEVEPGDLHKERSTKVALNLRSEVDRFARDWVSATFSLNESSTPLLSDSFSSNVSSLEKKAWSPLNRGLYGSLLFHGKSFERIEKVYELSERNCLCRIAQRADQPFVLGDLYARDAILQSMLFVTTPQLALPKKISAWRIHRKVPVHQNSTLARSLKSHASAKEIGIESCVKDEHGALLEELQWTAESASSVVIDKMLPTPDQLESGWSYYGREIHQSIESVCRENNFELPEFFARLAPGISRQSKRERRDSHRAYLERIVGSMVELKWTRQGRPTIAHHSNYKSISLTHDEDLCVYMLDAEAEHMGCDIVALQGRTESDWQALLPYESHASLRRLLDDGAGADNAGSVVWSLLETLTKCAYDSASLVKGMSLVKRGLNWWIHDINVDKINRRFCSVNISINRRSYVLSWSVPPRDMPRQSLIRARSSRAENKTEDMSASPFRLVAKK